MYRIAYLITLIITVSLITPAGAQVDNETDVYKTSVPPGMDLKQPGNKPSYRVVLPKGTGIRREGDLRIVEGTGEYAARKFMEYDAILARMNDEIAALRKDADEIKKVMAELQKPKLASK